MIVTTERGRYRVDELARGRFRVSRLDTPTSPEAIEVAELHLKVGLSFMFARTPWPWSYDWLQRPAHPRNRITAIDP